MPDVLLMEGRRRDGVGREKMNVFRRGNVVQHTWIRFEERRRESWAGAQSSARFFEPKNILHSGKKGGKLTCEVHPRRVA